MAERFDVLVQGITQEDALSLLFAKQRLSIAQRIDILLQRLGMSTCEQTLNALDSCHP